ncbi:MAG TPA: hypothetical protein VH682_12235 [Gemmataceae bacterium]|jgi:hypothetical protein
MNDFPQTPETPKQRLSKEYEDPHYHDDDDVPSVEDAEPRIGGGKPPLRRKPAYRPRRRFDDE